MRLGLNRVVFLGVLLAACAAPVLAWGPVTQLSVVTTAVRVLSQDGSIPLLKLDRYVWEGARISAETEQAMFPNFDIDPIGTIEGEMNLLQSVKRDRVDPYYAYRLGALGKQIARATAPLANGSPTYRRLYFADVDRNISRVEMLPSPRMPVEPQAYFSRIIRQAQQREITIEKDYQSGIGFSGLARAALSQDASRSVSAIADVWYTILSRDIAYPSVSRANVGSFSLDALRYYLDSGKTAEADDAYAYARSLGDLSLDFRERMGDLLIAAGRYEQGLNEYDAVLAAEPSRRSVTEKTAAYYARVGDAASAEGDLEAARDAFASAVAVDKLQSSAQRKLIGVQSLILERDTRLAAAKQALEEAHVLETGAERASMGGDYAAAIGFLRLAELEYRKVTDEFPFEWNTARRYLRNIEPLLVDLKHDLINNAQLLSGGGSAHGARVAAGQVRGVEERALRTLLGQKFDEATAELKSSLVDILAP